METAWIQAVKLIIQHVGEPGQGNPVAGVDSGKRPDDSFSLQSHSHMRIIGNIDVIVVVDELVMFHLPKYGEDDRRQQ